MFLRAQTPNPAATHRQRRRSAPPGNRTIFSFLSPSRADRELYRCALWDLLDDGRGARCRRQRSYSNKADRMGGGGADSKNRGDGCEPLKSPGVREMRPPQPAACSTGETCHDDDGSGGVVEGGGILQSRDRGCTSVDDDDDAQCVHLCSLLIEDDRVILRGAIL